MLAGFLFANSLAASPAPNDAEGGKRLAAASADSRRDSVDGQRRDGWTALHVATENNDSEAVSQLLGAGASANIADRLGRTPLHLAVTGSAEISQQLIDAGADPNHRDAGGISPIMLAAGSGQSAQVRLLLEAGARVDIRDYRGETVIDWSRRGGDPRLTRLLEQRFQQTGALANASGPDFDEDAYVEVKFPTWFKFSFLDLSEDLQEAVDAGKRGILLFLSARNCSYCKAFIDNSLQQVDIRERLSNAFDVIGMEIFDDSEMTDPAGRVYRVKEFVDAKQAAYTPTLIFYGAQAEPLLKIVGYYPPERFRQVLDYLERERYREEPLRVYLQKASPTPAAAHRGIILDKDLFSSPPYQLDRRAGPASLPLMVVFETADCPACERFHANVLQDKRVRPLVREFEAVQLDVNDTNSRVMTPTGDVLSPAEWYEQLELSYSPAVLLFDESGSEVMRLDSETKRYRMQGSLQLVLDKDYLEKGVQLQRWRRERARQLFEQIK